jgi:hypothetical protein
MSNYIPQSYPLWAWDAATNPNGSPTNPRLVVGWLCTADGVSPILIDNERGSGLKFRVSPFDPDVII